MIQYFQKKDKLLVKAENEDEASWVNISAPFNTKELEAFAKKNEIPLDFLTDSLDIDERSRYEKEDEVGLIVLNTPFLNKSELENDSEYITVPVGIIFFKNKIITITSQKNAVLDQFIENRVKNFDPANIKKFILQIFEKTVFQYLSGLKKLNLKRNFIEKELYDSSRNRELRSLLSVEKSLVYFVNSLSSNELLKMKMKRTDYLKIRDDEDLLDFFEDIIVDNSQALEMANVYTNILNGTMEAYASIISNNLNFVIHRLTLVTIILMVPTLVASFYGMNVKLPFETSPYAFLIIIFFSVMIILILVWLFRKRLF